MEKKQTAVEWLVEQIKSDHNQKSLSASQWMEVIEQAKNMEKNMLYETFKAGWMKANAQNFKDSYFEFFYKEFTGN